MDLSPFINYINEDIENMTVDSLFHPDFFEPFSCSKYSIDTWLKNFDPDEECYRLQCKIVQRYNQNRLMMIPFCLMKHLPVLANPENKDLLSCFIPIFQKIQN